MIYAFFGRLGGKKCFFWDNNSAYFALSAFLHGICCITELNLQIRKFAITRKNDAFVAKIANTRTRKSANFCHPGVIGENQYQWPDHNDFGDGENDDEDDET